ncbi:MAG: trypsin-like peptidase domain-containing protein [Xenococcus sp. MO_188.B8]|nr:trypsin-like peptidase domain-containing protein [Xenococcus sp. MO_188.B8]
MSKVYRGLERERIAEILVPDTNDFGTGYLIVDGLLLTASHVVGFDKDRVIKYRLTSQYVSQEGFYKARLIWSDENLDAALLEIELNSEINIKIPRFGKYALTEEVDCLAYGFPKFKSKKTNRGTTIREPETLVGWIKPLGNLKAQDKLTVEVKGSHPHNMQDWSGMSGAPLFSKSGFLIGIIIKGPNDFNGQRLEAQTIESIILNPEFCAHIEPKSNQEVTVIDISEEEKEKSKKLSAKWVDNELQKTSIEFKIQNTAAELEHLRNQLENKRVIVNQSQNKIESELNFRADESFEEQIEQNPKWKLLNVLKNVESVYSDLFWKTWGETNKNFKLSPNNVKEAYALLWNDQDFPHKQVAGFLASLYNYLSHTSQQEHTSKLSELGRAICEDDFNEALSSLASSSERSPGNIKSSLIVKINHTSPHTYTYTIWLIRNSQEYQERRKDSQNNSVTDENLGEKLCDSIPINVDSEEFDKKAENIKKQISAKLTELWTSQILGLQRLNLEVIFCVPIELLDVDYHNIELDNFSYIGWEWSVSVSCLDRLEDNKLNRFLCYWFERWQVLEDFLRDASHSHLEEYDSAAVDITCPRDIRRWLLQKDQEHRGRVAGIGFYHPYNELKEIFCNFIINGMPIVFWPQYPLENVSIQNLRGALASEPRNLLEAIRQYRINNHETNGKFVSIMFDNPYLTPPDCEIDYY